MTEGEDFIADYLESKDIDYRPEELIEGLENDSKGFRKADFYLPRYRIYIEYFGQWNSENQKARYREKRQVYIDNKIPCIILYPENLGILDYIFERRLEYVFNRYKMDKEMRKYYFDEVKKERKDNLILVGLGLLFLYWSLPWDNPSENYLLMIGGALVLYQSYLIVKSVREVYRGFNPVSRSYFNKEED